jgi:polyhydroxyalkanoate synthesis regulator phasin
MHDEMVSIFAGKLGISESELEARLEDGESMADIAADEGLSRDEFVTMMREARAELIDQAVKDGKITEEQAKWMKNRGMRMMQRWQEFRGNYGQQNNP